MGMLGWQFLALCMVCLPVCLRSGRRRIFTRPKGFAAPKRNCPFLEVSALRCLATHEHSSYDVHVSNALIDVASSSTTTASLSDEESDSDGANCQDNRKRIGIDIG